MANIEDYRLELILLALEKSTTWPRLQWPGRCEQVNSQLKEELAKAEFGAMKFTCGDWIAPIPPNSPFALQQVTRGTPLTGEYPVFHCWVQLADGRVADATRWAFYEEQEPYIYLGAKDYYSTERADAVARKDKEQRESAWEQG